MIIHFNQKDCSAVAAFLSNWCPAKPSLAALASCFDECDSLYLNGPPEELANCFMELTRVGFIESLKKLFQGDHFYRSDTIKCARCRRYRMELRWNRDKGLQDELCDRCIRAVERWPKGDRQ